MLLGHLATTKNMSPHLVFLCLVTVSASHSCVKTSTQPSPTLSVSCYSVRFSQLCQDLHSAVPNACLWAAGVWSRVSSLPGFVRTEASLKICLRSPPSVQRQVEASRYIDDSNVPHYSSANWPAPTDGPAVRWLQHHGQPGHAEGGPRDCLQCGRDIGRLLHDLGVGGSGRCYGMNQFTCCGPAVTDKI